MAKGWFNKILPSFVRRDSSNEKKSPVPQGLWQSCPNCKEIIYGPDLESNLFVCPNCDPVSYTHLTLPTILLV